MNLVYLFKYTRFLIIEYAKIFVLKGVSIMEFYVPDIYQESIFTINYKKLYLTGIRFLLFDLDNTIAHKPSKEIDERTIQLFEMLKKNGITPILFSNSPKKRVEGFAKKLDVNFVSSARKPFPKKFLETMKKYKFKVTETAIIGDQLLTDIKGGNKVGIITVLVNPISHDDPIWTKFARMREKTLKEKMRNLGIFKGRFYDEKM